MISSNFEDRRKGAGRRRKSRNRSRRWRDLCAVWCGPIA